MTQVRKTSSYIS